MDSQKDLVKWQWPFFLAFFVINFTGLLVIAYFGKDNLHLYFNKNEYFHNKLFDEFFKYYTDIATTYVLIGVSIYIILTRTWRDFAFLFIAVISSSIIGTMIKRVFFVHGHRPTYYFELKEVELRLIEGVESQIPYTFPSGHSILAIILCFYLCLIIKNRGIQFVICGLTGLVAIGRVYLSKHFVIDTIGGSFLGLFFAVLTFSLLWNHSHPLFKERVLPQKLRRKLLK